MNKNENNLSSKLLMKMAKSKLNKTDEEIKNDLANNNIDSLLTNVKENDKEKIKNILNDPEKIKKIVSSNEFKQLFDSFKK